MTDKTLPILFIFDLDNTLIGNPVHILGYKYLLDFIKDGCKHNRLNGIECKIDYSIWNNKIIDEKFFRPKLKESLQEIKTIFPNAEFFIFSLGTKDYVTSIVQFLEKYTGISFNRPLFTRENSSLTSEVNYLKDINGYYEKIFASISSKYPKCKNKLYQDKIINERTIIIDDNADVWKNDNRLVKCKQYLYKPVVEIEKSILDIIQKNKSIHIFSNTNDDIKIIPTIYEHQPYEVFKMNYHMFLANLYRIESQNNIEQSKDDFFPKFVKILKGVKTKPFNKHLIQKIKKHFA